LIIGRAQTAELVRHSTSAEEFYVAMKNWRHSFNDADGEQFRIFRIEVSGSAVSRSELLKSVVASNRIHID
jgi:hypothetical protein